MSKKKKSKNNGFNKYYILILLLITIIGLIAATYAYFQITADKNNSKATITANAECFDIEFEDLTEKGVNNLDINYPITDEYALGKTGEKENLRPIVVKVSNKCADMKDNLNYKLAITTLAKNPVNEQDKGYVPDNKVRYDLKRMHNENPIRNISGPEYLNSLELLDGDTKTLLLDNIGDVSVNLDNYDVINTYILDSDDLESNASRTYYIRLWIDYYEGDSQAYINSKDHIKGNDYDNSTQDQKFESIISLIADGTKTELNEKVGLLRKNDSTDSLSDELLGDLYRYQGSDADNYICLGLDDCKVNDDEMYRIIGIGTDGQIKVIKQTVLNTVYQWWEDKTIDKIWQESNIFKALNTDAQSFYNELPLVVQNNIIDKDWYYGDMHSKYIKISPDDIYNIETSKKNAIWISEDGVNEKGKWNKFTAKIGLLYLHDILYAANSNSNGCLEAEEDCTSSWLPLANNGGTGDEWIMSRDGYDSTLTRINAYYLESTGVINGGGLSNNYEVCPVFYLNSNIQLGGTGSSSDPYKIVKEENPGSARDYILNLSPQGLNKDTLGNMYRYQGTNADNYICLGTSSCKNKSDEMYRIIGITEDGQIKVIKQTVLSSTYLWWDDRTVNKSWVDSNIFKALNTGSDSFVSSLSKYVQAKIVDTDWHYGDLHTNYAKIPPDEIYSIENGKSDATSLAQDHSEVKSQWGKKNAKIGLLYLHDVVYAANNNENGCLSADENCENSWLVLGNNGGTGNEWMIPRAGYDSTGTKFNAYYINATGLVKGGGLNSDYGVRPVFYLNELTEIKGAGTLGDPFIITN